MSIFGHWKNLQFSSVQLLSPVWLFLTPWIAACQATLSITNSQSSLKLMSIELVVPSSHPILRCPLLLLPSIPPSIKVFSNESTLHMRWPKYWSFSIIPFKEIAGLISFRMDWLDLLAVQGTLKSLLQHHSSKASILWCSTFFTMVFPVVMYGYESWTIKKAELWGIHSFELCYWRRLLRVPWTTRRSNQSILKEINPEYSLKGLTLKPNLRYLDLWCEEQAHWKRPWCSERLRAGGEGFNRG